MDLLVVVGAVLVLAAIVGIYLWSTYNSLVTLNVRVDEAWSDITVQLKRRADLIPNLIEAVKGYADKLKAAYRHAVVLSADLLAKGRSDKALEPLIAKLGAQQKALAAYIRLLEA